MKKNNVVLMQGNEACVEGALAAGMRFFAGYPITPSTEIAEVSSQRLPQLGGRFIQMEDEIAAMAATIGGSVAGVKSMTATSGPGFSLKQENIGYASLCEVPCVIVNVQRSGPSTGLPTSPSQGEVMQSRWGTHGDHPIIVISPSSVAECYHLVIRCFNLSEKYRVPVIFLMDEIVGHLREGIRIPDSSELEIINRPMPDSIENAGLPFAPPEGSYVPVRFPFGMGQRYHITGLMHNEDGTPTNSTVVTKKLVERLMNKIEKNKDDIITYEEAYLEDAEVAVLCFGGTTRSAMAAIEELRERGVKAGMFRVITIWPFPEKQVEALSKKVKKIVVAEHNWGQLVLEVQRVAKNNCEVGFVGKIDGTIISPDEIIAALEGDK